MVETNTDLFGCIQFIVHHGIFCCSHIYPIDDCHTCVGKIKYYSIILSIITLTNVPIAYLMLHLGLHPAWVFAFQTFNQMIICVFRFLYLNKYLFISKTQYMRNVIFPTVWVSLLGIIVCYSISQISFTYQYANIVLEIIAMGILIVLFGFTKNERASVYNLVKLNRIFRRNA